MILSAFLYNQAFNDEYPLLLLWFFDQVSKVITLSVNLIIQFFIKQSLFSEDLVIHKISILKSYLQKTHANLVLTWYPHMFRTLCLFSNFCSSGNPGKKYLYCKMQRAIFSDNITHGGGSDCTCHTIIRLRWVSSHTAIFFQGGNPPRSKNSNSRCDGGGNVVRKRRHAHRAREGTCHSTHRTLCANVLVYVQGRERV